MKSMIYEDHSVRDMDGHTSVEMLSKCQGNAGGKGHHLSFDASVCLLLLPWMFVFGSWGKKKKIKMQIRTDTGKGFIASSLLINVVEKT